MKNNEKALSVSLILHLLLTLIEGALTLMFGAVLKGSAAIKIFSLIFTPVRFLLPVFLYRKASGYTPFVTPISCCKAPEKTAAATKTAITYIFALSLTVIVLNTVGALTDAALSFFGQNTEKTIPVSRFDVVYTFLKSVLFASVLEETLFRGALLHAFSGRKKLHRILLSAILFALMHGSIRQLFYAAAAGAVIAAFTVITGSLRFAAAVHFGANSVSFIFSLLSVYLPPNTYKTVSLVTLAVFTVTAVLSSIIYSLRFREKNNPPSDLKTEKSLPREAWIYIAAAIGVTLINML